MKCNLDEKQCLFLLYDMFVKMSQKNHIFIPQSNERHSL